MEGVPVGNVERLFRRRLRASGEVSEWDDPASIQWRVLRALCQEKGWTRPFDPSRWVEGLPQGGEHTCRHIPELERWEKVTHANSAGFYVDFECWKVVPATPLQYLERLALVNRYLGDGIHFLGVEIGPEKHTTRILTSQPHVTGEAPSPEILETFMVEQGFRRVHRAERLGAYNAMTFRAKNLWLFDVRPQNFKVKEIGGPVMPIDVIVQRKPPTARPPRAGGG